MQKPLKNYAANEYLDFMNNLKSKLIYKRKAPHKDKTS